MIVQCEHCKTRYRIPDEKVRDKGVKVRCAKCNTTFTVLPSREAQKPSPPPGPSISSQAGEASQGASPESRLEKPAAAPPDTEPEPSRLPEEEAEEEKREEPPSSGEDAAQDRDGDFPLSFDELFAGDAAAGMPRTGGEAPGAAEDAGAKSSPRPAHEKDRSTGAPETDEGGPSQELEGFSFEGHAGKDFAPAFSEGEGDGGQDLPFEPPASERGMEEWGNISLGPEAEKIHREEGIGLQKEAQPPLQPPVDRDYIPDLETSQPERTFSPEREPGAAAPRSLPGKGGTSRGLVFLLVLALFGAAGYLGYGPVMKLINPPPEKPVGTLTPDRVQVRSLARQDGKLLYVVRGEVRNNTAASVGMIQIEAQFRDAADGIVARSGSFCGNVFEDEQLATEDLAKIHSDLGNELGQSLSNSSVKPGQAVPFLVVLEDPPPTVSKVTVTISGFKETI